MGAAPERDAVEVQSDYCRPVGFQGNEHGGRERKPPTRQAAVRLRIGNIPRFQVGKPAEEQRWDDLEQQQGVWDRSIARIRYCKLMGLQQSSIHGT